MNIKKFSILWICLLVAAFALAAASCGGGSGGGGSTPTPTPTPTATETEDPTFNETDLAGSWTYAAGAFTGTMSFDSSGSIVYVTVNECSSTHYSSTSYVDNDSPYGYNIFVRTYGYCNHPTYLMKFALLSSSDKKSASGVADLHYDGDGSNYTRYSCTMVKDE